MHHEGSRKLTGPLRPLLGLTWPVVGEGRGREERGNERCAAERPTQTDFRLSITIDDRIDHQRFLWGIGFFGYET